MIVLIRLQSLRVLRGKIKRKYRLAIIISRMKNSLRCRSRVNQVDKATSALPAAITSDPSKGSIMPIIKAIMPMMYIILVHFTFSFIFLIFVSVTSFQSNRPYFFVLQEIGNPKL